MPFPDNESGGYYETIHIVDCCTSLNYIHVALISIGLSAPFNVAKFVILYITVTFTLLIVFYKTIFIYSKFHWTKF